MRNGSQLLCVTVQLFHYSFPSVSFLFFASFKQLLVITWHFLFRDCEKIQTQVFLLRNYNVLFFLLLARRRTVSPPGWQMCRELFPSGTDGGVCFWGLFTCLRGAVGRRVARHVPRASTPSVRTRCPHVSIFPMHRTRHLSLNSPARDQISDRFFVKTNGIKLRLGPSHKSTLTSQSE